jgi:hypothetical protein
VSSNRRLLIVVAAVVVALVAVFVLIPRGTSPTGPGPGATCAGDVGPSTPSAACASEPSGGPSGSTGPSDEPSSGTTEPSQEPVAMSVGLGYIPSVQFAPFYLADQAG